jgi:hypothetical protein
MLILGFIYAVSISWNINGISHNFIHNPYFRSPLRRKQSGARPIESEAISSLGDAVKTADTQ